MNKLDLIVFASDRVGVSPQTNMVEMERITESRCHERPGGKQYAWCGDFATYCLMCCGCHDGGALNRVALNGKWKPGQNIAMLVAWAKGYQQFIDFEAAEAGDIIVFANNTGDHICFLEKPMSGSGAYVTIDGNSGNVVARNSRFRGNKPIRCCISTGMLLEQSVKPSSPYVTFPFPPVPTSSMGIPSLPSFDPVFVFPVGELMTEERGIRSQDHAPARQMLTSKIKARNFYNLIESYQRLNGSDFSQSALGQLLARAPEGLAYTFVGSGWPRDLPVYLEWMLLSLVSIGEARFAIDVLRLFALPIIQSNTESLLDEVAKLVHDTTSQHAYFDQY